MAALDTIGAGIGDNAVSSIGNVDRGTISVTGGPGVSELACRQFIRNILLGLTRSFPS